VLRAATDCALAVQLDPSFSRARTRLASCLLKQALPQQAQVLT